MVKGIAFRNHKTVGGIVELAKTYSDAGADELVFYDITASPENRSVESSWIGEVAKVIDIPFCVAGGIRSIADAERILNSGADKVSINTPAINNPDLIGELARRFGTQCVVIGIDSFRDQTLFRVHKNTGDPSKSSGTGKQTLDWIKEVQDRGAGEIVLNCMNQDGMRDGYDLDQLTAARERCTVPLIASGGAGTLQHFADVFDKANVAGALAASVFHRGHITIQNLKHFLQSQKITVRV